MILHTVNKSPFASFAIGDCLELLSDNDSLLLIEDAVIATAADHHYFAELDKLSEQGRLFVLAADLDARGICNKIAKQCCYAEFVELAATHQSQLAW
ncbi:sulfurtransferase complex subunit TusB [Psychromonas sp. MME2]|uniref:sulfurtransferase complex subunit TusB n=1 Tax=unclassified Psychromonas TaxID=2614957 RepID=UPI00339D0E65